MLSVIEVNRQIETRSLQIQQELKTLCEREIEPLITRVKQELRPDSRKYFRRRTRRKQ